MRLTWLAFGLGIVLAGCGATAPFHVQQRPPFGGPFIPGAFARPPFFPAWGTFPTLQGWPGAVVAPAGQVPAVQGVAQAPAQGTAQVPTQGQAGGQQTTIPSGIPLNAGTATPTSQPTAKPAVTTLVTLTPKGQPSISMPSGVTAPKGIPNFTKASLSLLSDNSIVLVLADGSKLTGQAQRTADQVSFSFRPAKGGSITGVLTTQVGEPFTAAYVIKDTSGQVFTIRQEYSKE